MDLGSQFRMRYYYAEAPNKLVVGADQRVVQFTVPPRIHILLACPVSMALVDVQLEHNGLHVQLFNMYAGLGTPWRRASSRPSWLPVTHAYPSIR